MKSNSGIDKVAAILFDWRTELEAGILQMICQDCVVDGEEGVLTGKDHSKGGKMPLQPGVDRKTARSGIHAADVLRVVDILH